MATTTQLNPYPLSYPSPAVRYLCRSWWTCYSTPRHTWRIRCDYLLATGQPLSVIPPTIRENLHVVIKTVSGWKGQVPTWLGIPCTIGRVTVWLPVEENPGQYRDFSLVVLLPKRDVDGAPPFIHLGTQFLLEYQAKVILDGSPSRSGQLIIP